MHRVGCLPMFVTYLAIGVGVISVGLNGLISIPLDQKGDYALSPERGHFLYLAAPDGSSLTPFRIEAPVVLGGLWSPDKKRLLYIIPTDPANLEGAALFVTDDPQTPGTKILDVPGLIISPSFSPDGEKIAYIHQTKAEVNHSELLSLHVVEVREGAEPRLLLQPVAPYSPQVQWSPDGRELLAVVEAPAEEAPPSIYGIVQAELIRVEVATGAKTPVTKLFIGKSETMGSILPSVIWTPDNTIIFNSFEPEHPQSEEQIPPLLLYAWHLQEQRRIRLTEAPAPTEVPALYMLPTLSPSGKQLAYLKVWQEKIKNEDGFLSESEFLSEIYVMDLDSGEQQRIAGPGALFQPFWIDENRLGYVEFAENVATVWIQDLEKRTRRNLSSDLKTLFWEERLRAAQPEALRAELEKLQAQLTKKEAQRQELEEELRTQQHEIQALKQRLKEQENEIASLQRKVEAQRASPPLSETIFAISIVALVLLWAYIFLIKHRSR